MNNMTISAKTYDEAITKALIQLQTTSDHLIVETVQEGSSGFFGIGAKQWIIRARVKSEEEEAKEAAEKAAAEKAERERKAAEKAAAEKAERERKAAEKAAAEKAERERKAAEKAAEKAAAEKIAAERPVKEKQVRAAAENEAKAVQDGEKKLRHRSRKDGSRKNDILKTVKSEKGAEAPKRRKEEPVGREVFEEEANEIKEKAVTFLKELFRVMDEEIEIDTDFNYQDNELGISLSGGDMGVLIGKRGQTLDSLQYLVSLVVNKHRDVYIRVKLDTENYRERREQKLKSLARNIAHKVKKSRKPVSLEPMNPYARRIIHSALQRDPYVTTYSEGEDPFRHIVVALKKNPKRQDRPFRRQRTEEAPAVETQETAETE